MSTLITPRPVTPVATAQSIAAVPFSRLLKVELRKTTNTRAGFWLLVAIGVITAAVIAIYLLAAQPQDLTFERFLLVTMTPQGFLLPVMAILAVTAEWSQRTGLVTFTLESSRMRVTAAKLAAVTLLGLAAIALALALAAVGNVLGMSLQDGAGDWNVTGAYLRDFTVLQLAALAQGFAFGLLLMHSAGAIVLYFVVPTVWSMLFILVDWLADIAPWVDLGTAADPILAGEALSGEDWLHVAVAGTLWVLLPLALGLVRLTRSEVKSS
jgi:ABC-type transport system involved in multi-copper enzyme maturation permease subunit